MSQLGLGYALVSWAPDRPVPAPFKNLQYSSLPFQQTGLFAEARSLRHNPTPSIGHSFRLERQVHHSNSVANGEHLR